MSSDSLPVRIFVPACQVEVDGDYACVGMSFASAEDFSRRFLRALEGDSAGDAGGEG